MGKYVISERVCQQCGKTFLGGSEAHFCPQCRGKMAVVVKERTCVVCGRTFEGGPSAKYCPDCRAEQRRKLDAIRRANRNVPNRPLGSIDHCAICGKEYIVTGGNQKYCPDCAHEAVRALDREKSRQWNAAHKETSKANKEKSRAMRYCVICGAPITSKTPTVTCDRPECKLERKRQRQRATDARRRGKPAPEGYTPTRRSAASKKDAQND